MGFGIRVFSVNDQDEIKRISYASFGRILSRDSKEAHLEYKNTRIRYAEVILEIENERYRSTWGNKTIASGYASCHDNCL